jgi:hypothetical protein
LSGILRPIRFQLNIDWLQPNEPVTVLRHPAHPAHEVAVRYFDSLSFVFKKENWITNTLLGVVCMLIPINGHLVLLGYM